MQQIKNLMNAVEELLEASELSISAAFSNGVKYGEGMEKITYPKYDVAVKRVRMFKDELEGAVLEHPDPINTREFQAALKLADDLASMGNIGGAGLVSTLASKAGQTFTKEEYTKRIDNPKRGSNVLLSLIDGAANTLSEGGSIQYAGAVRRFRDMASDNAKRNEFLPDTSDLPLVNEWYREGALCELRGLLDSMVENDSRAEAWSNQLSHLWDYFLAHSAGLLSNGVDLEINNQQLNDCIEALEKSAGKHSQTAVGFLRKFKQDNLELDYVRLAQKQHIDNLKKRIAELSERLKGASPDSDVEVSLGFSPHVAQQLLQHLTVSSADNTDLAPALSLARRLVDYSQKQPKRFDAALREHQTELNLRMEISGELNKLRELYAASEEGRKVGVATVQELREELKKTGSALGLNTQSLKTCRGHLVNCQQLARIKWGNLDADVWALLESAQEYLTNGLPLADMKQVTEGV